MGEDDQSTTQRGVKAALALHTVYTCMVVTGGVAAVVQSGYQRSAGCHLSQLTALHLLVPRPTHLKLSRACNFAETLGGLMYSLLYCRFC